MKEIVMRANSRVLTCVFLLLSCVIAVNAQAAKSELTGEVRDQNGALVPQVKLTLVEVATAQVTTSNAEDGNYTITNLKPGAYRISAEANGFKQAVHDGVKLTTGE